jgi:cell wall-associated NlpC family hydrolase
MTVYSQSQAKVHQTVLVKQSTVNETVSRSELISFAKSFLGTPYRYGSSNPKKGFDCSGFVNFVFNHFKIKLPRSSMEFKSIGTDLHPEEFKEGDVLVFYGFRNKDRIGHVGIICEANGMKSKFIHSSSGKVKGVIISELGSEMYTRRFYKCVDVIAKR